MYIYKNQIAFLCLIFILIPFKTMYMYIEDNRDVHRKFS